MKNLFTEPQTPEVFRKVLASLSAEDNKRMLDDLQFVKTQHQYNPHLTLIDGSYRIGFALAVIWTRANLTAKPRKAWGGAFDSRLYEPEKSAFLANFPSDTYFARLVLHTARQASPPNVPSAGQIANKEETLRAKQVGYSSGWSDGSDYVRSEADLPLETSIEDRRREEREAKEAARARENYRRVSEAAVLKYYDECMANGHNPQPVKFQPQKRRKVS